MWALIITPVELITTGCVLIFGALMAAVLLRTAVSVVTWLTGEPTTMPPATVETTAWPEPSPTVRDSTNPYSAPSVTAIATEPTRHGVSFRRACRIGFVQSLVSYGVVIGAMTISILTNSDADWWIGPSSGLFALTLVNARILCRMLPTTYRRGLLITLIQILAGAALLSPIALLQV